MPELAPGDVWWADFDPVRGREQSGRRPALVVCSAEYLRAVTTLVIVVPITAVDRQWPNHIGLVDCGLPHPSWAMTEQPRTLSRARLIDQCGRVDQPTLVQVRGWLRDFFED